MTWGEGYKFRTANYTRVNANKAKCSHRSWADFVVLRMRMKKRRVDLYLSMSWLAKENILVISHLQTIFNFFTVNKNSD